MNGLEAIELMKQGKKVSIVDDAGFYQINDGKVWFTYPTSGVMGEISSFDLSNEYCEYIEPKRLTGWERVGEKFVFIAPCSEQKFMDLVIEKINTLDADEFYESANYFSTEEKCLEICFKQELFRKLQRFSDENGGFGIDWNDSNQIKYYIAYDLKKKRAVTRVATGVQFGQVYFYSYEVSQEAIRLFHDDLIKYFTHDWSEGNE